MSNRYIIWNHEDNISASIDTFTSKKAAKERIEVLRDAYKRQGWYRNNRMEKVPVDDVVYTIEKITGSRLETELKLFSGKNNEK